MLFADFVILCSEEKDNLEVDLDKWSDVLERH